MTTLVMPSLQRRLIKAVDEELQESPVSEWAEQGLHFLIGFVGSIRKRAGEERRNLEEMLVTGVEARSFTRDYEPVLAATDQQVKGTESVIARLISDANRAPLKASVVPLYKELVAELRALVEEKKTFCTLLADALGRASAKPRPVDLGRARSAEEAYDRGETKPFSRR